MPLLAPSVDSSGVEGPILPSLLHGVLIVNKPDGWTSHDVVQRVRTVLGIQKVGHAGPSWCGVNRIFWCGTSLKNGNYEQGLDI